jgi:hypothetical protein
MTRTFKTSVRLFLGVPVTAARCTIHPCSNEIIHPNGEHNFHAKPRFKPRHDRVRDAIGHVFQRLYMSSHCDYACHFETAMSVLGIPPKMDAPDKRDAVVDFYLENPATNHVFFTDVMITHPSFRGRQNHVTPLHAAEAGVQTKYKRYLENYEVNKADVIPLVFDTYGGYAEVTYQFLQQMASTIGRNDAKLAAKVLRTLRDRIAVALHTGHSELIHWLNSRGTRR